MHDGSADYSIKKILKKTINPLNTLAQSVTYSKFFFQINKADELTRGIVCCARLPEKIHIQIRIHVSQRLGHLKSRISRINPVLLGRSVFALALLIPQCLRVSAHAHISSHHLPRQHTGTLSLFPLIILTICLMCCDTTVNKCWTSEM